MENKEKFVEERTGAEIICHSEEELEFYVKESTDLINKRHQLLLNTNCDSNLLVIKRKKVRALISTDLKLG